MAGTHARSSVVVGSLRAQCLSGFQVPQGERHMIITRLGNAPQRFGLIIQTFLSLGDFLPWTRLYCKATTISDFYVNVFASGTTELQFRCLPFKPRKPGLCAFRASAHSEATLSCEFMSSTLFLELDPVADRQEGRSCRPACATDKYTRSGLHGRADANNNHCPLQNLPDLPMDLPTHALQSDTGTLAGGRARQ